MNDPSKETFRKDQYASRYSTSIFRETADDENPYLCESVECHGYSQLELIEHLAYPQYLYLLMTGNLPNKKQSALLNRALIAFSNPGVRHPATRAAVAAGVGKTVPTNVLPAALLIMGGEDDGAGAVVNAMKYFYSVGKKNNAENQKIKIPEGVFGQEYGSASIWFDTMCERLIGGDDWSHLIWGKNYLASMRAEGAETGWRFSGLVSAMLCDLGVTERYGPSLLQMLTAPGLAMQGMENAHRSPTILPFVTDENYDIKNIK